MPHSKPLYIATAPLFVNLTFFLFFQAIEQHSATKPALVFVSSRRQTRLTALDLISFLAGSDNPKKWLKMDEAEMEGLAAGVKDQGRDSIRL